MSKAVKEHDRVQQKISRGREPIIQKVIEYGINNVRGDYERAVERDKKDKDIHDYVNAYKNTHSIDTRNKVLNKVHQPSEHIEQKPDKAGLVPPPFKYLGPGNSLNRGPAYNQIDADAKKHDTDYNFATNQKDIHKADRDFISKAGDHIIEGISGKGSISDTIGAIAGGIGIGVKHLTESKTGVIYPSNLSGKMAPPKLKDAYSQYEKYGAQWLEQTFKTHPDLFETDTELPGPTSTTAAPTLHESTTNTNTAAAKRASSSQSGGTPAKVPANVAGSGPEQSNIVSSSEDIEMSTLPGTGKEMADIGGSGAVGQIYTIERPFSMFENRDNVYRKSHKFMTFGIAPNILQYTTGTGATTRTANWLTSYLAEIPWHIPALYMNQGEFNNLDAGTQVKSVTIEVYYRGTTLQFATASSATNLATLNQINDIAVAHALNKTGQGSNVSYTSFDPVQTMIPTGITRPKYDAVGATYRGMLADYYGVPNNEAVFDDYIPNHQIGRQTFLYNYWAQNAMSSIPGSDANAWQFNGWPLLVDKIQQMDGKTCVNQCVLKAQYNPKMGMLTQPLKNFDHGLPFPNVPGPNMIVNCGGHLPNNRHVLLTQPDVPSQTTGAPVLNTEATNAPSNNAATVPTFDLYTPIEKSQIARTGSWGEQDPHVQPSIHIGVQPVPALTTSATLVNNASDGTWTDVRGYWEVIATMHTKEYTPTSYPWSTQPNVPVGDVIYFTPSTNRPAINNDPRSDGATWQGLYTNAALGGFIGADI